MPAFSGVVFWYLHGKREASRIVTPLPRVLHTELALPHRALPSVQSRSALHGICGSCLKRRGAPVRDGLWALVHVQGGADAVAGAVAVVEAHGPEGGARQGVQRQTWRP